MASLLFLLLDGDDVTLGHHEWGAESFRVGRVLEKHLVLVLRRLGKLIDDSLVEASRLRVEGHDCE